MCIVTGCLHPKPMDHLQRFMTWDAEIPDNFYILNFQDPGQTSQEILIYCICVESNDLKEFSICYLDIGKGLELHMKTFFGGIKLKKLGTNCKDHFFSFQ